MAGKLIQELRQSQNLMMTPQLQQAIKLLTLTHLEMTKIIAEEMVENPLLEEDGGESTVAASRDVDYQLSNMEQVNKEITSDNFSSGEIVKGSKEEFDWDNYIDAYNSNSSAPPPPSMSKGESEDSPNYENMLSKEQTLAEYLEWQLRMVNLTKEEWKVAELVIRNLDDEGYLEMPFEDIIEVTGHNKEDALEILKMIQVLDPTGCACRSLEESLMVQAENLRPRLPLVELLIREHLKDLEKKDYIKISKKLGMTKEKIKDAELVILSFNPRPGRFISSEQTHYVVPDIYVYEMAGSFVVGLNEEGVPRLKISQLYQSMLKDSDEQTRAKSVEYVQDKLRSAMWLIKSIQNRQKTIMKVAEAIVKYQPEFFRKGPKFLRPMILKDIASEIGMHESTVSRVTVNKYMHTPIGTFELKYFFNAGLGGKNGGSDVASETLKLKIKAYVDRENALRPLSDQKIVQLLFREDIVVARRTVAKYREMMSILPSSKRKKR